MTEAELAASPALRAGIAFLHAGFFWESHEVLEPVWMALPEGPARQMAQALIQLANARLKDRMGRPRAAARLRALAAGHLAQARQGGDRALGLDPAEVAGWIVESPENAK
jgi:predicted metal-dependent hydrolase